MMKNSVIWINEKYLDGVLLRIKKCKKHVLEIIYTFSLHFKRYE